MTKTDNYLKNSRALYVIKFFAILSVVFAHCSYDNTLLAHSISGLLGSLGVPIFLISSGIFFNHKENAKVFWMKKFKGLIVPWLLFGVLTYLLTVMLGTSFETLNMFRWMIGHGTWLYFVTILLFYYVFFRAIRWEGIHYVAIALWVLSNVLDVFEVNIISNVIGQYLNPFSRIGYFSMGVIAKKAGVLEFKMPKLWIKLAVSAGTLAIGVATMVVEDVAFAAYFAKMVFSLCATATLFFWSQSLSECKLLQNIGKQTYLIYFLHMQLGIGAVNAVVRVLPLPAAMDWVLLFVKPVAILALIYIGIVILNAVVTKLGLSKYKWIIGMK